MLTTLSAKTHLICGMHYQLAQINLALAKAPLDTEAMAGFTQGIDEMNDLAEKSPGFVWRFKGEGDDATSVRAFSNPLIIVNMSVWKDLEPLKQYVYKSMHGRFFAQRAKWFEKMEGPHLALWWIPAGSLPTLEDAKQRLKALQENGESDYAFTFRAPFQAPASE